MVLILDVPLLNVFIIAGLNILSIIIGVLVLKNSINGYLISDIINRLKFVKSTADCQKIFLLVR